MFPDSPVCAHCGQGRAIRAEIIDVWPAGIAGVAARARLRMARVRWSRVRRLAWRVLTRLFGMSLVGSVVLSCLVLVAGS